MCTDHGIQGCVTLIPEGDPLSGVCSDLLVHVDRLGSLQECCSDSCLGVNCWSLKFLSGSSGGSVVPAMQETRVWFLGREDPPGGGNGNPLQYSCLENSIISQFSSVAQSCPALCDLMDCNLPGSSVHGILQARILQWVAISSSQGIFPTQESKLHLLQVSCVASGFFTAREA